MTTITQHDGTPMLVIQQIIFINHAGKRALREGFEPSRGVSPTGSPGLRLSELGYLSMM